MRATNKILFFDGSCAMCSGLVRFAIKHDKKRTFAFAPLQGATANELLKAHANSLNTVVLRDELGIHTESDAIIRLLYGLGGIFRIALMLKIFPRGMRDSIYRIIAKNRYKWFGKTKSCRLLSPEERMRILE